MIDAEALMRFAAAAIVAFALTVSCSKLLDAQTDPDRVIPDGGILVRGWTGKIDAASATQGRVLNDARFAQEGDALHVTTGPATTFWNPANTASGDYTVKATFREPKFMNLNSHPHSYGLFVGGNDMGTDRMSLVLLRRVRRRPDARPRLRPGGLHALPPGAERRCAQSRGSWTARDAGDRLARDGRSRRMPGQWEGDGGL